MAGFLQERHLSRAPGWPAPLYRMLTVRRSWPAQIGQRLRVSQMHVSRLRTHALGLPTLAPARPGGHACQCRSGFGTSATNGLCVCDRR